MQSSVFASDVAFAKYPHRNYLRMYRLAGVPIRPLLGKGEAHAGSSGAGTKLRRMSVDESSAQTCSAAYGVITSAIFNVCRPFRCGCSAGRSWPGCPD
jgi:hypothetical protein